MAAHDGQAKKGGYGSWGSPIAADAVADVKPPEYSVRSLVHSYGGGAYEVRAGMALMSPREPLLVRIHTAIYRFRAATTMDARRNANPFLAKRNQAISGTGW